MLCINCFEEIFEYENLTINKVFVCPFCGTSLNVIKNNKTIVYYIKCNYGEEIFKDIKRYKALLSDFIIEKNKKNALVFLEHNLNLHDVYKLISEIDDEKIRNAKLKNIMNVMQDYGFGDEVITYINEQYCIAYNIFEINLEEANYLDKNYMWYKEFVIRTMLQDTDNSRILYTICKQLAEEDYNESYLFFQIDVMLKYWVESSNLYDIDGFDFTKEADIKLELLVYHFVNESLKFEEVFNEDFIAQYKDAITQYTDVFITLWSLVCLNEKYDYSTKIMLMEILVNNLLHFESEELFKSLDITMKQFYETHNEFKVYEVLEEIYDWDFDVQQYKKNFITIFLISTILESDKGFMGKYVKGQFMHENTYVMLHNTLLNLYKKCRIKKNINYYDYRMVCLRLFIPILMNEIASHKVSEFDEVYDMDLQQIIEDIFIILKGAIKDESFFECSDMIVFFAQKASFTMTQNLLKIFSETLVFIEDDERQELYEIWKHEFEGRSERFKIAIATAILADSQFKYDDRLCFFAIELLEKAKLITNIV